MAKKQRKSNPRQPASPPSQKSSEAEKSLAAPPAGFTLRHTLRGQERRIGRIAWSPDGRFLASSSTEGTIHVWDADSGLCNQLSGSNHMITVSWAPNGQLLAAGGRDGNVHVWDSRNWKFVSSLKKGHSGSVTWVSWSPDSRILASREQDSETVLLWNIVAGVIIRTIGSERATNGREISWSPDGRHIATSGDAIGSLRVWNSNTGELARELKARDGLVVAVTCEFPHEWWARGEAGIMPVEGDSHGSPYVRS